MEDVKSLVEAFKEYRDLLTPVTENLREFADTYDSLKGDIGRLSEAFEGDVTGNLDRIYKTLTKEAEKAQSLSHEIDAFLSRSEKYEAQLEKLSATFEKLDGTLSSLSKLESDAEEQIGKLESTLDEKRKNYNLKELERTVASYNAGVTRVADFINKDVAAALSENSDKLNSIKGSFSALEEGVKKENKSLEELAASYAATSDLLRKITEGEKVNEEYIFDVLDKWAADRGVKRKK
ncbi:MAG: hypothetical protein K5753_03630 [Clostridia bacterium]|nr:hypothetical protein [Clostridia bacterium]